MKKYSLSVFLFLVSIGLVFGQKLEPKEKAVFDEIAYRRVKVGEYEKIIKWSMPIYYKIIGDSSKYAVNEIDTVFSQLRKLTKLEIRKSNDDDEVNFVIALSVDGKLPSTVSDTFRKNENSSGGFTYRINQKSEIYYVESLFVLSKYNSKVDVRYSIRKTILAGMGFFKRSEYAPASIFYSANNRKLKFDAFDSAIIAAFYNEKIKPGMTKEEVDPLFQ